MYRVCAMDRTTGLNEFVSDLLSWEDVETIYFRTTVLYETDDFEVYIKRDYE